MSEMDVSIEVIEQKNEVLDENKQEETEESSDKTTSENSSDSSSSQEEEEEVAGEIEENEPPPVKRRRKRKRRPKKKKTESVITAYVPEEPFTARYKFLSSTAIPKLHLRFDSAGNADEDKSEFNYKPRIIAALEKNLSLCEGNKKEANLALELTQELVVLPQEEEEIISLKPRIIEAIIV